MDIAAHNITFVEKLVPDLIETEIDISQGTMKVEFDIAWGATPMKFNVNTGGFASGQGLGLSQGAGNSLGDFFSVIPSVEYSREGITFLRHRVAIWVDLGQ